MSLATRYAAIHKCRNWEGGGGGGATLLLCDNEYTNLTVPPVAVVLSLAQGPSSAALASLCSPPVRDDMHSCPL